MCCNRRLLGLGSDVRKLVFKHIRATNTIICASKQHSAQTSLPRRNKPNESYLGTKKRRRGNPQRLVPHHRKHFIATEEDSTGCSRFEQSARRRLQSKIVWVWLMLAENSFSETAIGQRQKIATAIIADRRQLCHIATN